MTGYEVYTVHGDFCCVIMAENPWDAIQKSKNPFANYAVEVKLVGINISNLQAEVNMSEYPDNKVNVTLPDPGEGYKWGMRKLSRGEIVFKQVRIAEKYDWSRVGDTVLVYAQNGSITVKNHVCVQSELVTGIWQAHIGGDPCPVHAEATMVEIMGQPILAGKASGYSWKTDTIYRVTGLAPGYEY